MKMKRALALALALICCLSVAVSFVGCNGGEKESGKDSIYTVNYNGTDIALGADAKGVLKALGTAKDVKELGDCGGLGAQVKYSYNDLDVYTIKNDKGETVDQITFRNDLVATSKGICIGDSSDKVLSAYGEPTSQSDTEIKYVDGKMVLKFKLEGGNVTDIDLIRVTQ